MSGCVFTANVRDCTWICGSVGGQSLPNALLRRCGNVAGRPLLCEQVVRTSGMTCPVSDTCRGLQAPCAVCALHCSEVSGPASSSSGRLASLQHTRLHNLLAFGPLGAIIHDIMSGSLSGRTVGASSGQRTLALSRVWAPTVLRLFCLCVHIGAACAPATFGSQAADVS